MASTPIYYFDISKIGKDFTGKKDVLLLTNEEAILEGIKNLLITEPGERVMNPEFGCPLSQYIFEPIDGITMIAMKATIINSISRFEKRVENLQVFLTASPDNNTINIDVIFNMKTSTNQQTLGLTLNKIR